MKKERFSQNGIVRKVAFAGMLSALAVAFSALESLLTPVLPPGRKAGACKYRGSCSALSISASAELLP